MSSGRTSEHRRAVGLVAAAAVVLLIVLWVHLVGALFVAALVYLLMSATLRIAGAYLPHAWAGAAALTATLLILVIVGWGLTDLVGNRVDAAGGLASLADMLANTLDRLRTTLPAWAADKLPASVDDLQHGIANALRSHAQNVGRWGQHVARDIAHVFIAVVTGVLAALERPLQSESDWLPLIHRRGHNFLRAFSDILLAQISISAVNTVLTAAFLLAGLPAAGIHLPFSGVLVGLTFVAGLLPIVGNLLSNAAVIVVALTVSPAAALASLGFLLAVHKLEYVLNARFAGRRTGVPASALLASMVLLEAIFGAPGLVAGPIYCAWLFRELRETGIL